jgi:hypothetical protein
VFHERNRKLLCSNRLFLFRVKQAAYVFRDTIRRYCKNMSGLEALVVYTPVETQFTHDAEAAGLTVVSGYELFFWQGVHAWTYFADLPLDLEKLRADLLP